MKKVLAIFIGAVVLIGLVYYLNNRSRPEIAKAGASDNVYGWAWAGGGEIGGSATATIGWISFNCYNDYDNDGVRESHCASSNYGVKIDPSTGLFSGYAWAGGTDSSASGTIGWIDFAPAGPYPESPDHSAKLDLDTYKVSGWARALSATSSPGGWDGWIKLNGTTTDGTPYGVSLNPGTKEFEGWAAGWDDSTSTAVIGWISFNCKDGGSNGENICATSSYKVATSLVLGPIVSNPTSTFTYCAWGYTPQAAPGLAITLSWYYSGLKPQSSYEIWLDNEESFSDPKFNHSATSSSYSYALDPNQDDVPVDWGNQLAPNTTYYWKVKVTDTAGNSSWSNIAHFTTPDQYPHPDFTPSPSNGTVGQVITFNDESTCYASPCSYLWDFGDGATSSATTTSHTYNKRGTFNVTLRLTDGDAHTCTSTPPQQVTIQAKLPWWREIIPK